MKKFKITFNTSLIVLSVLVLLLAVSGAIVNGIILFKTNSLYNRVTAIIMLLVAIALVTLILSVALSSSYQLKEDKLVMKLGILSNKISYAKIKKIVLYKKEDKLSIYYDEKTKKNAFMVVLIKAEDYDDFTTSLRDKNSKILYEISSDEE